MTKPKAIVVGATGTIGGAVVDLLEPKFEVVRVARHRGDFHMDALSVASIAAMYAAVGPFDALVSTMGSGVVGAFESLPDDAFLDGFQKKAVPQINLVRLGLKTIRPGGSFTLSSGYLSKEPRSAFSAVAVANGAVDAFCRAAALEMPNGVRLNCVSPVFVLESMQAHGMRSMAGYDLQTAAETARAYHQAVIGTFTGRDIDPRTAP